MECKLTRYIKFVDSYDMIVEIVIILLQNVGILNLNCTIQKYITYLAQWLKWFYEGRSIYVQKVDQPTVENPWWLLLFKDVNKLISGKCSQPY